GLPDRLDNSSNPSIRLVESHGKLAAPQLKRGRQPGNSAPDNGDRVHIVFEKRPTRPAALYGSKRMAILRMKSLPASGTTSFVELRSTRPSAAKSSSDSNSRAKCRTKSIPSRSDIAA